MRLIEGLLELVAPTRCSGCDLPGALLCDRCLEQLPAIDPKGACPRCGAPYGWLVCTECWERGFSFGAARCAGSLEHPLSRVITVYKDAGERRLASLLAVMLAATADDWGGWADLVSYVPATATAVRRRGFDHAERLAVELADQVRIPLLRALVRPRARDQRDLGREARLASAARGFEVRAEAKGRILLVDDVFTTGATLDAASEALLKAGASEVRVLAVARTW